MPKLYVRCGVRARRIRARTDAEPLPGGQRERQGERRCAMKSLVVYESWFGNTRRLAETIAAALRDEGDVELVSVDDPLPSLLHVDLIVLGAPTHVHGLSSARSR